MINLQIIVYLISLIFIIGSLGIWINLFFTLKKSLHFSPVISKSNKINMKKNLVSIIIPARNEEKYIKNCILSLLDQNYNNYEIIVVDDNSSDKTIEILQSLKNNNHDDKIRILKAGKKPQDWVGKNWPCYVGYKNSRGDHLLFTDADTIHYSNSVSDSIYTLLEHNLDVLTAVPNLIYPTFIVKMVLPVLSIFMFSRYSPIRVNDPKIKLGYLFGSFFIISKTVYEKIGTHECVKSEIVEDGALGQKIKEAGYKLKMFRGEDLLRAYWARDFYTLWNSLKRLIIPVFFTNKKNAFSITIGVFVLMVLPFLILTSSLIYAILTTNSINNLFFVFLFIFSFCDVLFIYLTNYYQLREAKTHNVLYFLGTPIGCFIISLSFILTIISSEKKGVIKWRDRIYHYSR
jgi:chlorobactene glucosyltransferase